MCAKFVFNFPKDNNWKVFKMFEKFATKMEDEGPLKGQGHEIGFG